MAGAGMGISQWLPRQSPRSSGVCFGLLRLQTWALALAQKLCNNKTYLLGRLDSQAVQGLASGAASGAASPVASCQTPMGLAQAAVGLGPALPTAGQEAAHHPAAPSAAAAAEERARFAPHEPAAAVAAGTCMTSAQDPAAAAAEALAPGMAVACAEEASRSAAAAAQLSLGEARVDGSGSCCCCCLARGLAEAA